MIRNMAVRLTLGDYLKGRSITPYKLAKEAGLSTNTIYNLLDKENPPVSIRFDSLNSIITALYEITGEPLEISDILVFRNDEGIEK